MEVIITIDLYDSSEYFTVRNMLSPLNLFFYRGVQRTDRELCDNHLKINISKTNELVLDYQRNRRPVQTNVIIRST